MENKASGSFDSFSPDTLSPLSSDMVKPACFAPELLQPKKWSISLREYFPDLGNVKRLPVKSRILFPLASVFRKGFLFTLLDYFYEKA